VFGTLNFAIQYIGNNRMSREISWHDFQMKLLETGSVDRIIVTNNKVARVVLKPNANADILDKVTGGVSNKAYSNSSSSLPSSIFNASDSNTTNLDSSKGASSWHESDNFGPQSSASGAQSGGEVDVTLQKGPNAANPDLSRYPSIDDNGSPQISFYFNIGTVDSFERKLEEAQRALGISPRNYIPVVYSNETDLFQEALRFLPTLLLMGGMVWLTGRAMGGGRGDGPGGIFRFGKSTAKKIEKEQVKTTFAHVAGCDEAKREIMEFVQFLKDPKKFTDLGAKIPKGALLCGPPGTGKTLLAKATAGEADVPFYAISGSDFVEMFVGVGPSRVRDLFEEARNNAPCIIFIDEIDAVGRQRGKGGFSGGNDERENTLNQLLVEMDGFDKSTNIVILAGTNRSDILDAALTRPGRFDRQIMVDRPDIKGRKQIFEIYLKDITLDDKMEDISGRLAALTPGFVGADIANICNEAAIVAARRNKKAVQLEDFESATDRVIGGLESRKIMSPEEKKVVAYHEAGHAIAGWFLEHADPLLKVTIVPRGSGALGFAQYLPKELFLRTRDQIMDMVCMALAGRAAEEVNFGRVTTGAADDLRRVTQIVYQMVTVYGMNDKIGQVAFPKEEGSFPGDRLYSDATAEVMDEEVRQIVAAAYERTLNLMRTKKNEVGKVAEVLLSKETITNMDIASLIGRRPFAGNKEYDEYINFGWKGDVKETSEEGSENKESKEKPDEKTDDELSEKLLPV
jgi:AFG3 family protein